MNQADDLIRSVVAANAAVTFVVDTTFEMDFCTRCLELFRNEPVFTRRDGRRFCLACASDVDMGWNVG